MNKKRILVIQETDWVLRGPHQHHHLIERLDQNRYDVRIIDYPLIWEETGKRKYPLFQGPSHLKVAGKAVPSCHLNVYRGAYINLPLLRSACILLQRRVIRDILRDVRPHVVICFASLLNVNYVAKLCKAEKIPFIYYLLEKYYTLMPIKPLRGYARKLEHKAIRDSDLNLVLNQGLKEYVDEISKSPEKSIIIPGGVELKKYENATSRRENTRSRYGIKKGEMVLFFMGFLYTFSGLKEVARELAMIKDEVPDVKLLIVGDGDAYEDLRRIREKYDLKQMILTGKQPYEKIPEFIAAADICLLPAYPDEEVMQNIVPIKMYEYMAMGKPVIATKLPGIMKEFGEGNGVIYIDRPEDAVKKAIELREKGKILEEGKKARRFAERYDWNKIVDEFEKVIESLRDKR